MFAFLLDYQYTEIVTLHSAEIIDDDRAFGMLDSFGYRCSNTNYLKLTLFLHYLIWVIRLFCALVLITHVSQIGNRGQTY